MSLIAPSDVHHDWLHLPSRDAAGGVSGGDYRNWAQWVVKLQFKMDNQQKTGTGFFVNLDGGKYSVVLTAGHNLINEKKELATDLKILREREPGNHEPCDIPVDQDNIRICEEYEKQPKDNRDNDYGAILLPYDDQHGGFGFYIGFAFANECPGHVSLVAHHSGTTPGNPSTYNGTVLSPTEGSNPNRLLYKAGTVKGNSGCPVWVAHESRETVIAIHTFRAERREQSSGGVRLNMSVLQTIFRWADVGWRSKLLKVTHKDAPKLGLYLMLSEDFERGHVRLGPEGLGTFDIFPAFTRAGKREGESARYVFIFVKPPAPHYSPSKDENHTSRNDAAAGDAVDCSSDSDDSDCSTQSEGDKRTNEAGGQATSRWVCWNFHEQRVELARDFNDDCLVRLKRFPPKQLEIVRDGGSYEDGRWKLRMIDDEMPVPETLDRGGTNYNYYRCAGVSFVRERLRSTENRVGFTLIS